VEFGGGISPTRGFRRAARTRRVGSERSEAKHTGNPRIDLDGASGRSPSIVNNRTAERSSTKTGGDGSTFARSRVKDLAVSDSEFLAISAVYGRRRMTFPRRSDGGRRDGASSSRRRRTIDSNESRDCATNRGSPFCVTRRGSFSTTLSNSPSGREESSESVLCMGCPYQNLRLTYRGRTAQPRFSRSLPRGQHQQRVEYNVGVLDGFAVPQGRYEAKGDDNFASRCRTGFKMRWRW
jgi:hypothetical protein